MTDLASRLSVVEKRIHSAMARYGRAPGSVSLIAVSKTKPKAAILEAYEAGQRRFGESYAQEAVEKIDSIDKADIEWHFVGPIQSNKTRQIAERFQWVHSVERLKIAKRLGEQRPDVLGPLNICLQVNVSNEASKSGVSLDEVEALAVELMQIPRLTLRGLMAIPQRLSEFDSQRENFLLLANAMEELNRRHGWQLDTLSMGMSQDLEAAIAAGSTMVRVGTDIFGARDYPASPSKI